MTIFDIEKTKKIINSPEFKQAWKKKRKELEKRNKKLREANRNAQRITAEDLNIIVGPNCNG